MKKAALYPSDHEQWRSLVFGKWQPDFVIIDAAAGFVVAATGNRGNQADRLDSFIVGRRAGLPPNPLDRLSSGNTLTEWVTPSATASSASILPAASRAAIVEAQSWTEMLRAT